MRAATSGAPKESVASCDPVQARRVAYELLLTSVPARPAVADRGPLSPITGMRLRAVSHTLAKITNLVFRRRDPD